MFAHKKEETIPTCDLRIRRCLGGQSSSSLYSMPVSWSIRFMSSLSSSLHKSLERERSRRDDDVAAMRTRRCGDPRGLVVDDEDVITALEEGGGGGDDVCPPPRRFSRPPRPPPPRPGSKGLTQTELLMEPLAAMEP